MKESEPSKETEETEAPKESEESKETEATEETGATEETAQTAAPKSGPEQTDKKTKKGAVVHSGSYRTITWTIDDSGKLTISGSGSVDKDGGSFPWMDYSDSIKKLVVESSISYIAAYAFKNCTNLTEASIADSVISLGSGVFSGCTSLVSVTLPKEIDTFGTGMFSGCVRLKYVKMPTSLEDLYGNNFFNCKSLESITLPSDLKKFGAAEFKGCTSLKTISIPSGVQNIQGSLFSGCTELKSVELHEGLKSISYKAFYSCEKLESIQIPSSVTMIDDSVFENCKSLKTVKIPSGITNIEYNTFKDCESLESVDLPSGLTIIDFGAFSGCKKLKSIKIPDNVTTISDSVFAYCESLESITIPKGVTSISSDLFYGCKSLKNVAFNGSITAIGSYAFEETKIASFDIPDGITKIEEYTFSGCTDLTTISIPKSVTSINRFAFKGCTSLSVVNYAGSEEAWSNIVIDSTNAPLLNATINYAEENPDKYNIIVNSGTSDYSSAVLNKKITITADAAPEGKGFYEWVAVKGNVIFDNNQSSVTTFQMPDEDVEITATYKDLHTVTVHSGTADITSSIVGKMITITADSAPEGAEFDKWVVVKGNVDISYESATKLFFFMPDEDVEIKATYKQKHTITVNSGTSDYQTAYRGTRITITAGTAPEGKGFCVWEVVKGNIKFNNPNSSETYFTMPDDDVEIKAVFKDFHTITVVSGTADKTSSVEGQVVTIKASDAPEDKEFDRWQVVKGNVSLNENHYPETTFTMPDEDVEIKATYKDFYLAAGTCGENISWKLQYNGLLKISGSGPMYSDLDYGWENYKDDIRIIEISDGITSIGNSAFEGAGIKLIQLPKTITSIGDGAFKDCKKLDGAYFDGSAEDWIKVVIGDNNDPLNDIEVHCGKENGIVSAIFVTSGTAEKPRAANGDTVAITADPAPEGKVFDRWDVISGRISIANENSSSTTFKITGSGKIKIQAIYKAIPTFDVTLIKEGNGTVEASPDKAKAGTQITIKATPDSGYYFKEWQVTDGGVTLDDPNSATTTFTIGSSAVTVKAVFEEIVQAAIGDTFEVSDYEYSIIKNAIDGTGNVIFTGLSANANPVTTLSLPATVQDKGVTYNVTGIGANAMKDNTTVKIVAIGSKIVAIGNNAFFGCKNLVKVSGGAGLKTIGTNAFARCPKLSTFVITSKVLYKIGPQAFYKDSKLKTVCVRNTTKLTKGGVKKSLKGSSVKTVRVKKSKVKKFKKYFTKKNCGRKVKVKK